jgi:hypothetical protein
MKYERGHHDGERVAVLSGSADCASRRCRACQTHPAASSTRPALCELTGLSAAPGCLASGQPPRRLPPQGRLAEVDGSFTHPPGPAKSRLCLRS